MELNGTIFLQIFIFLTLLLWLSRSLFAPIMRLFNEREQRILGAKEQASEMERLAHQKAQEFDHEYAKARDSARLALSELKHTLEKDHQEQLNRVKLLAKAKLEKSEAILSEQEKELRPVLMKTCEKLSDEVVAVFLRKTVQ